MAVTTLSGRFARNKQVKLFYLKFGFVTFLVNFQSFYKNSKSFQVQIECNYVRKVIRSWKTTYANYEY